MKPDDDTLITEPSGRFGIRVIGYRNPSPFLKRTAINRNEAERNLIGHKIDLVIPAELLPFTSKVRQNPKGKGKQIFDDPYLEVTPKLAVPYRTQEYLDPKTGLPKIYMKKGIAKSGAAHDKIFPFESTSLFSKTSKMSAPSFSLPAGPTSIGGTCAAADINKRPKVYEAALSQGDVEQAPATAKKWICNFCLAGDTRVPVKGMGLVRMDEVVAMHLRGERLSVLSDSGWTRVTNAWERGIKNVVRVSCSGGQDIRVTPDHKILTTEGWVEAADLAPGDRIVVSPRSFDEHRFGSNDLLSPIEVTPEELARGAREPAFPISWSKAVGLFLGYMVGNGGVSRGNPYPNINLTVDERDKGDLDELVYTVNQWCGSDAKVKSAEVASHVTLKTGQEVISSPSGNASAHVAWRRKCLLRFLDALGLDFDRAKEERRVPSTIWKAPAAVVAGFLSGLFSTDGSVLSYGGRTTVTLASVSPGLLRDVQVLLLNFGIHSSICAYETSNRSRVAVGYLPLYKIDISSKEGVSAFRELVGLNCKRKAALLSEANCEYSKPWSSRRYAVVEAVTPEGKPEDVFDIEVEHEDHRFIANGLVVSNCYSGKSNYMHRTSQYGQTARKIWLDGMLAAHDVEGTADVMAGALAAHLGNVGARASMKESSDFFRIHDSGDLIPATYLMWRLIAMDSRVSRVKFWCPTRAWVFPRFGEVVRQNPPPDNLTLRPSALHFGDQAPLVDGFDAGSTAHPSVANPIKEGKADWLCPAYEHDGKSCAGAGGPKGEKDCRVCWTYKDMRPSYRSH